MKIPVYHSIPVTYFGSILFRFVSSRAKSSMDRQPPKRPLMPTNGGKLKIIVQPSKAAEILSAACLVSRSAGRETMPRIILSRLKWQGAEKRLAPRRGNPAIPYFHAGLNYGWHRGIDLNGKLVISKMRTLKCFILTTVQYNAYANFSTR